MDSINKITNPDFVRCHDAKPSWFSAVVDAVRRFKAS